MGRCDEYDQVVQSPLKSSLSFQLDFAQKFTWNPWNFVTEQVFQDLFKRLHPLFKNLVAIFLIAFFYSIELKDVDFEKIPTIDIKEFDLNN